MKSFFSPNITKAGRIVRGVYSACLLAAGGLTLGYSPWLGGGLLAAGLFALFETCRGWCLLRACGIKTRL